MQPGKCSRAAIAPKAAICGCMRKTKNSSTMCPWRVSACSVFPRCPDLPVGVATKLKSLGGREHLQLILPSEVQSQKASDGLCLVLQDGAPARARNEKNRRKSEDRSDHAAAVHERMIHHCFESFASASESFSRDSALE